MNNPKTSRYQRTALVILLVLLIIAFSVLLALYINVKQKQNDASQQSQPNKPTSARACASKQCLRSASDLAMSMDKMADPCDDFYQYVCGNWENVHPQHDTDVPNDWFYEKTIKVFAQVRDTLTKNATGQPKPVEQARDFYASCMDTGTVKNVGVSHVFEVLKSVNLPPFPTILNVNGGADSSTLNFDWLDTVIKIKTQLDMHIFIGFDIFPLNTSENILVGFTGTTNEFPRPYRGIPSVSNNYRQTSLTLLHEESLKNSLTGYSIKNEEKYQWKNVNGKKQPIKNSEDYNLLKKYVKESGVRMGISDTILHQNIIQSLEKYKQLNDKIESLQRMNVNYGKWNVDDLQSYTDEMLKQHKITTQAIWKRYLQGIFNVSDVKLDIDKDMVIVDASCLSYAVRDALLTPPDVLELYMWMKVVKALNKYTNAEKTQRSLQCSTITNELLGMAVSYAIVEPDIFEVTKPKVLKMISEIKNSLRISINKADWMDDYTKKVSNEKITNINALVGIPEWFYEPGKLEEYYEGVETSRDTYLKNMVNIVQARLRKHMNKFRDPNYFSWTFEPSTVNAAYKAARNSITVPVVMLQYPFFDLGLESLNYGNLGVVLGHEITHGFDNNGRQYDMNGNYIQWWSDDSIRSYNDLAQCFERQYSSYYVTEIDKYVNGTQTLGENIADNGGLNQALRALKQHLQENGPEEKLPGFEHLSSEQLFFLSFAHTFCGVPTLKSLSHAVHNDTHTPAEFRIRGTLTNSEEFARAWNCPIGSSMNPDHERCAIF